MPDVPAVPHEGVDIYVLDESRPYRRRFYLLLLFIVTFSYLHVMQDWHEYTQRWPHGSVVVVTGSSSGIGFEMARRLVQDGMIVFGTYRNLHDRSLLEGSGIKPLFMELTNVSSVMAAEKQVRSFVAMENKSFLGIISNAGVLNAGPFARVDLKLLEETVDVHLKGTMIFVKVFMDLVMSNKGGRIVIMGSLAALLLPPANAACK